VLKIILPAEKLWVDDDFEIIAVEVKGNDLKCTWEIIGIYRASNEDIGLLKSWLPEPVF
jgi:hypothetical protein